MPGRTLTHTAARSFYDRFGAKQDDQAWYEDAALENLVRASRFSEASSVLEFGCGTGRLAETLLEHELPGDAVYRGIDISDTMVTLSRERLSRFGSRATVALRELAELPQLSGERFDRFLSTYVLDLLPAAEIEQVIAWAFEVLEPDGLICLAGITRGPGLISGMVMGAWSAVSRLSPVWVGGCRPVVLTSHLDPTDWSIEHREVVISWGVASEVIVARRADPGP